MKKNLGKYDFRLRELLVQENIIDRPDISIFAPKFFLYLAGLCFKKLRELWSRNSWVTVEK